MLKLSPLDISFFISQLREAYMDKATFFFFERSIGVYLCVYIYMYVCIHMQMYKYMCICALVNLCVCRYLPSVGCVRSLRIEVMGTVST